MLKRKEEFRSFVKNNYLFVNDKHVLFLQAFNTFTSAFLSIFKELLKCDFPYATLFDWNLTSTVVAKCFSSSVSGKGKSHNKLNSVVYMVKTWSWSGCYFCKKNRCMGRCIVMMQRRWISFFFFFLLYSVLTVRTAGKNSRHQKPLHLATWLNWPLPLK